MTDDPNTAGTRHPGGSVERRRVPVGGGAEIAVQLLGAAGAPWMVLLHALGDRADDWAEVAAHFATTHRVAAIDLPGHGESTHAADPAVGYAFARMRDDVVAVLDALDADDLVLVGHSLGGTVAILAAQAQPERLAALVVEDTCPPYPRDRPRPTRPDGPLTFDWEVVPAVHRQVDDPSRQWWPGLAGITAPALFIAGGPTSHVPQELIAEASALVPDSTLVTIPAGHEIHRARPEEFIAAVDGWMAGLGAR